MATKKIDLLASNLAALPIEKKRTYWTDSGDGSERALRFVIQPTGHCSFEIYRKISNTPRHITLGKYDPSLPKSRDLPAGTDPLSLIGNNPLLNARMARRMGKALNIELDKGNDPPALKKAARKKIAQELTIQSGFDLYFNGHLVAQDKRRNEATRDQFNRLWGYVKPGQKKPHGRERQKTKGAPDWSARKISTVSTHEITAALLSIKECAGARSANLALQLLRATINWLIKFKHFEGENNCTGIPLFSEGLKQRKRYLGEKGNDEIRKYFDAQDALGQSWHIDYFDLSLLTGARQENVLAMQWSQLNLDSCVWNIPDNLSKNNETLQLILSRQAAEILRRRRGEVPDGCLWVFPSDNGNTHRAAPRKKWKQLLETAGIENLHLHDLRHTIASGIVSEGVGLPMVGAALGHKSVISSARYAHIAENALREHIESAEAKREKIRRPEQKRPNIHKLMLKRQRQLRPLRQIEDSDAPKLPDDDR